MDTLIKPDITRTEEYISYMIGTKLIAKHYDKDAQKVRAIIIKEERYELVTFTLLADRIERKLIYTCYACDEVRSFIKDKEHWHNMSLNTALGGRTGEMVTS